MSLAAVDLTTGSYHLTRCDRDGALDERVEAETSVTSGGRLRTCLRVLSANWYISPCSLLHTGIILNGYLSR
jgi:hypothetical protein